MDNKKREEFIASLKVEGDNSQYIKGAKGIIYPNYTQKNGIDGLTHINHTTHLGIKLGLDECDNEVHSVALGCLLHDIGRGNEVLGQTHGNAGREIAKKILRDYFDKYDIDIEKIIYAVQMHDKGKVTTDRLIGSVWDADRLSLYRFKEKKINMELLSTEAAKELLDYAKKYIENHMSDYSLDFEKGEIEY